MTLRRPKFYFQASSFDVTELTETSSKSLHSLVIRTSCTNQDPYNRNSVGLLCSS